MTFRMSPDRHQRPKVVRHTQGGPPMTALHTTRRRVLGGAAGISALGAGLMPRTARAAVSPTLPPSPVALNVVDVAGQLQLTQRAMDTFAKANPKLISKITCLLYTSDAADEEDSVDLGG